MVLLVLLVVARKKTRERLPLLRRLRARRREAVGQLEVKEPEGATRPAILRTRLHLLILRRRLLQRLLLPLRLKKKGRLALRSRLG